MRPLNNIKIPAEQNERTEMYRFEQISRRTSCIPQLHLDRPYSEKVNTLFF
jgi:hypothetical protein